MKKSEVRRLQNKMNLGRAIYFESFKRLYEPIIKKLNHNGVYDPIEFNKKYMLRSSLKGNYVPLMDVKKDYIPKSKLPDYIKKYEAKHNKNGSDNSDQDTPSGQNDDHNNNGNTPDDDSKLNDSDGNNMNNYPE